MENEVNDSNEKERGIIIVPPLELKREDLLGKAILVMDMDAEESLQYHHLAEKYGEDNIIVISSEQARTMGYTEGISPTMITPSKPFIIKAPSPEMPMYENYGTIPDGKKGRRDRRKNERKNKKNNNYLYNLKRK